MAFGVADRTPCGLQSMDTKQQNQMGDIGAGGMVLGRLFAPCFGGLRSTFSASKAGLLVRFACLIFVLASSGGCKSVHVVRVPVKTELPENWFRPSDGPGMLMRRVVILPVYNEKYTGLVMKDIDDAFLAELSKLSAFEVVSVSRADMETIMGRRELSSVEPVSVDFFRKMRDVYGAEGVMFVDLTSYSPYRPVSMGVRCKLVDVQAGRIHWASDALYDAGNERTAAAARAYGIALGRENFPVREDGGAILLSPKRFARFAAFASFRSLRKDRQAEGAE
jgi:hypothetical protein